MYITNIKNIIGLAILLGSAVIANASNLAVDEIQPPELPGVCTTNLQVQAGSEVTFPRVRHRRADLSVERHHVDLCGTLGKSICRRRLPRTRRHALCRAHLGKQQRKQGDRPPDRRPAHPTRPLSPGYASTWHQPTAPGIFSTVNQILRVNTTGGLIPTTPGTTVGQEARVPYTAEYYFYSLAN
jgi:hypothetical protein